MTETRRVVTVGVVLRVTTAQLTTDMPELASIREQMAEWGDQLMASPPGAREVELLWQVERLD